MAVAYADVVARAAGGPGLSFESAGTHGLVGRPIDPPMGELVSPTADPSAHVAQQLTRELIESSDLILAMSGEHWRYILDEWPAAARKTFIIGHAAREIGTMPSGSSLADVTQHLWRHCGTSPRDEVDDPYRRGPSAALKAARTIDTHLQEIFRALKRWQTHGSREQPYLLVERSYTRPSSLISDDSQDRLGLKPL